MITEIDVTLADGRTVHAFDSGPPTGAAALTLVWHHGSPQTGALLPPVLAAASERGIRLLSYARPSYTTSTPLPGRDVASAAADTAAVADALGVDRFATMGASGGGPHALACAALLPGRVGGVVCLASPAPLDGFDWAAGMHSDAALRSAARGREARALFAETDEFDPGVFTAADFTTLDGEWGSLGADAGAAEAYGPDGLIDDDVAFATAWGFDLVSVTAPVLLVQGGRDRMIPPSHADRLAGLLPHAEVWRRANDGHVSVLAAVPDAMDWLLTSRIR